VTLSARSVRATELLADGGGRVASLEHAAEQLQLPTRRLRAAEP
jgi:hypothetical protein